MLFRPNNRQYMTIGIAKIRRPGSSGDDPGFALELDPERFERLIRPFHVLHLERDLNGRQVGRIVLRTASA